MGKDDVEAEDAIASWLARLRAAHGIAERRFARAGLERALACADPESLSDAEAREASALGISRELVETARRAKPPHAVRVPLVTESGRAVVRMFELAFEPLETRVVLGAEADAACQAAIALAAARMPAPPDPRRYRFVPCATLEGALIEGHSLAAACFVSAAALFRDRPVRAGAVVTGALEGERVVSVGGMRAKAAAAQAVGASPFVCPVADAEGHGDALGVASLDALEAACLADRAATSDPEALVERAARAARDGWSGYRWRAVREATTRALAIVPTGRPDLRVDALAQLAGASRHLGDLAASARAIELAVEVVESPTGQCAVPDDALCRLERQRAMLERSRGRLSEAGRAARRAVTIARRARMRGELLKALGVEGLVAMARGADDAALVPLHEALAITLERTPTDAARSRAYLVEALGRLGRLDEARRQAELALEECALDGARGHAKEGWVRTSLGGALVACERWTEARDVLSTPDVQSAIEHDPLPGLVARRWLGIALHRTGEGARASTLLTSGAFAYGDALDPSLRFAVDVGVAHDLAEQARAGAADPDRTAIVLDRLAGFEAVTTRLGRKLDAARRALGRSRSLGRALEALALAAGRLA